MSCILARHIGFIGNTCTCVAAELNYLKIGDVGASARIVKYRNMRLVYLLLIDLVSGEDEKFKFD